MQTYIKQYILEPPLEKPEKRRRCKLKTFSKKRNTLQSQQSKISRVSKMNKSMVHTLKTTGQFYDQVMDLPLAICDEFGKLRTRTKSLFNDVLKKIFPTIFETSCLPDISANAEVIVDFLKFVHIPPKDDIYTYNDWGCSLWRDVVCRLGFDRGAQIVTLVIDKAKYLPKIRGILHVERKDKHTSQFTCPNTITAQDRIPQSKMFCAGLSDSEYKAMALKFLCDFICNKAKAELSSAQTLIIDAPLYDQDPVMIHNCTILSCNKRHNNKGEADMAVWWHARWSPCSQVVVHATDTDIYLIGATLFDIGFLPSEKQIIVERHFDKDYISINNFCAMVHRHPVLSTIQDCPVIYIFAIYILSGSDYISNFYGMKSEIIFQSFLKYSNYVSPPDDPLVKLEYRNEKPYFNGLSVTAFTRLFCCAYLDKNANFYKHLYPNVTSLLDAINRNSGQNISPSLKGLFEWLQIDPKKNLDISDLTQLTDLTRRICYFSTSGPTVLFKSLLPSDAALSLHTKRGEHVIYLAVEQEPITMTHEEVGEGWISKGNIIEIKWDEKPSSRNKITKPKLINKCSCKNCSPTGTGCRQCTKSCLPCSDKCKCKGKCANPHNNGGSCVKCKPVSEDSSDTDCYYDPEDYEAQTVTSNSTTSTGIQVHVDGLAAKSSSDDSESSYYEED
jgi:hypothetical protein